MDKDSKIYVAGHRGMVGSAIVRELKRQGYNNIITRTHAELDLVSQQAVNEFFEKEKPEYVFLAAAKVGGIIANSTALADFMYDNMMLEMNVINAAWRNGCKKLEFLGSSCIYPRLAPQPMPESCLLTSELEKTNEAYALAKISGLKYCEYLNKQYGTDYISVMPTNLYGPNDNYHPEHSHVLPALIRRFHEAKEQGLTEVTCWGDGSPLREFLYVDDLANLCVFLMNNYSPSRLSPSLWQRWWVTRAKSCGTPHAPTAHPASCLMCQRRPLWVGLTARSLRTASDLPMRIFSIIPCEPNVKIRYSKPSYPADSLYAHYTFSPS